MHSNSLNISSHPESGSVLYILQKLVKIHWKSLNFVFFPSHPNLIMLPKLERNGQCEPAALQHPCILCTSQKSSQVDTSVVGRVGFFTSLPSTKYNSNPNSLINNCIFNASAPIKLRYVKKEQSLSTHVFYWTANFVEGLYESEAKILSDGWNDVDCECLEGVLGETAFYDTGLVACLPSGAPGGRSTSLTVQTRWWPHGCI